MGTAVDREADAIVARLNKPKPCAFARHPKRALIEALLVRKVHYKAIAREVQPYISDFAIRVHAVGECTCQPKP